EQRLAGATANAEPAFANPGASGVANALEPEMRTTPRVKPIGGKPKWPLYAAIAGGAVVIGVVIAIVTRPGGGGGDDEPKIEPNSDPSPPAGQANAALEQGNPDKAISILEGNKVAIANDPLAHLVLGHAYASKHASAQSLVAYTDALKLQPGLESNAMLRTNL